jgi:hypothetical protein
MLWNLGSGLKTSAEAKPAISFTKGRLRRPSPQLTWRLRHASVFIVADLPRRYVGGVGKLAHCHPGAAQRTAPLHLPHVTQGNADQGRARGARSDYLMRNATFG